MNELDKLLDQLNGYVANYEMYHDRETIAEMHRITGELLSLIEILDGD